MQQQFQCPRCNAPVAYGVQFCQSCGHQFQQQSNYQQQAYQNQIKPKGTSGLKIAALILGVLGGLGGFMGAIFALFVGGIGSAFKMSNAGTVVGLGWAAVPIALIGIIGGAIAIAKSKIAGILMLLSGIAGFIAISAGYIFGGPLLIIGGVLALVASREQPSSISQPKKKTKPLVIILAIIGGCILLFSTCAICTTAIAPKSIPVPASSSPDLRVTAKELYNTYKDNAVSGDAKYKGKILSVSGNISNIGVDITSSPYIVLTDGSPYAVWGIQCYFNDKYRDELSQLRKGQSINVDGTCDGYLINVILRYCVIR